MQRDKIEPSLPLDAARRRQLLAAALALGAGALPRLAFAQDWPTKPVRLVAAQAPGSSNDATARAVAEYMTSSLGQAVVVENKPGGIGMIAADNVARSPRTATPCSSRCTASSRRHR